MHPHHIFLFRFYLNERLGETAVDVTIIEPKLRVGLVDIVSIGRFESMEKCSQILLVEQKEFLYLFAREPDWVAFFSLEKHGNLFLFFRVLRYDARPANPLKVDEAFLSELVDRGIQHALALFDRKLAGP